MPNLTQLRLAAREIFHRTLREVDPTVAVQYSGRFNESQLIVCDESFALEELKVYSVAIGKAAFRMAIGLEKLLADSHYGSHFAAGVISGNHSAYAPEPGADSLTNAWQLFEGAHPLPDARSFDAARAAIEVLREANANRGLVIFLISGGGSAMFELPIDDRIGLADIRLTNRELIGSGASILEINAVRRAISAVKGGKLASFAPDCEQITLIVSDVPKGEESSVASGPTIGLSSNAPDPREVIERYYLRSRLPANILNVIDESEQLLKPATTSLNRKHFVLLDNRSALDGAMQDAWRRRLVALVSSSITDQPIETGCQMLAEQINRQVSELTCFLSGGEFSCPVRGEGIGGRNLETALRLAMMCADSSQDWVALCAGTDGIDGNSPAAGAIVDSTTIARARAIGLDPEDFLNRSDAYSFFVALGEVIATGPTGTNVRDLRILLRST